MLRRSSTLAFLLGIAVGLLLPALYFQNASLCTKLKTSSIHMERPSATYSSPPVEFNDSRFHADDDTSEADRLYQNVRVLCLVFAFEKDNSSASAKPVNSTWGRRCNKLLFVSTRNEAGIPIVVIDSQNTERHGDRMRETLDKVFADHLEDYEWFVKADVKTYIILENLRYFLSTKDHRKPVYFSDRLGKENNKSCGTAYVFSREAVRLFGQRSRDLCKSDSDGVDFDFDGCVKLVGITPSEPMDPLERDRFHCLNPEGLIGTLPQWFDVKDMKSGKKTGMEKNTSDYAIAFHYLRSADIYTVEYFVYHLNPYGIIKDFRNLNAN